MEAPPAATPGNTPAAPEEAPAPAPAPAESAPAPDPEELGPGLHGASLKDDAKHYTEHVILDHVVQHVEDLFDHEEDLDEAQQEKRANERRLVFAQLLKITAAMDDEHVVVDLAVASTDSIDDITVHMLEQLQAKGALTEQQCENAKNSCSQQGASGGHHWKPAMAHGLAVPLIYTDMTGNDGVVPDTICAFARLDQTTHVGESDGEGIRFVFLLLEHEGSSLMSPRSTGLSHVSAAEAISFVMHDVESVDHLILAKNAQDIHDAMEHYVQTHRAWEKGGAAVETKLTQNQIGLTWEPDKLPFGGIKRDFARRSKVWIADWKDGFTAQSFAVVIFMFFACVAPAIAFGSLLDTATGGGEGEYCKKQAGCEGDLCPCVGDIGVIEMLVSSACCGIMYAAIGGSPLTILGGTGPILVFTGLLFKLAHSLEVEFLPFYAWTGVWIGVISIFLAAFDVAVVINRVTRFTDEIFSGLISAIFTLSAILDLVKVHDNASDKLCGVENNSSLTCDDFEAVANDNQTATSVLPCMTLLQVEAKTLVSVVLAIGTYSIAMAMRAAKSSGFYNASVRKAMGDFGVAFAIFCMVIVHEFVFTSDVDLLNVPATFERTNGQPWFIGLGGLPGWAIALSIIPAILGMLLVWLDNNITYRIVNSPDHKLTKGTAYHWDTMVTGVFIAITSLFGLPWLVAATVRSLLLCKSLATTANVNGKDRIVHVNDNRFTGFAIHCLLLGAVFLPNLLKKIPVPVIFGLFLYMGVSSMAGNTFFERLELMAIWEGGNLPADDYIKQVPRKEIYKFTAVQLVCLIGLYFVKSTAIGISFPVFIGLLPVVRHLISKCNFVEEKYCALLDPEELDEAPAGNEEPAAEEPASPEKAP